MNQIAPMLAALRRHQGAALLIICNVALCAAIVCNALHLAGLRLGTLLADSGWPENEVLVLNVRAEDEPAATQTATTQHDLALLRALPGVRAAAISTQVPWWGSRYQVTLTPSDAPDQPGAGAIAAMQYNTSAGFIDTMGLTLVAGRDFSAAERMGMHELVRAGPSASPPAVILSAELARTLFPHGAAVGQTVRIFGHHATPVVGVVEGLYTPDPKSKTSATVLMPITADYGAGSYVLRVAPARRAAVAQAAVAALRAAEPRRSVGAPQSLAELRREAEGDDRVMAAVFAGVVAALLTITACGIVGLASFWVQQRTRMIGIRRALGATQAEVRRYFQLENALLTGAGVLLGMAGAFALSLVLKSHWEVPALPWPYLPLGALTLMLLGQAAVLAPARRAARVPPMAALRS